uniref:Uncharacterized protein n=1 Tax=Arundo donax TaxID=35708 RepID=A0A0A9GW50_ARUDO
MCTNNDRRLNSITSLLGFTEQKGILHSKVNSQLSLGTLKAFDLRSQNNTMSRKQSEDMKCLA